MMEPFRSHRSTAVVLGPPVDLGQAWGWYAQVGKYIIPRKLELAVRYGFWIRQQNKQDDLTNEFGAAINYSFDGTYNNRLVIDYSNITNGKRRTRTGPLSVRDSTGIRSRSHREPHQCAVPVLFLRRYDELHHDDQEVLL